LKIEFVKNIKGLPSAYVEPTEKESGRHARATEEIHDEPDASGASKYATLEKTGQSLIASVVHNTPSSGCANLSSKLDSI
jgi:hypothetical protein